MRVFITGATGLIGGALTEALGARGDLVLGLSRREALASQPGIQWLVGDPTQGGTWQEEAARADAVVHLAGESIAAKRWTRAQKAKLVATRIESTRLLVQAFSSGPTKPRMLVSASATGYYGPRGEEALSEDSPPGADFLAKLCAEWEQETRAVERLGMTAVQLRLGVVLSRHGGALDRMLPLFKLGLGGPIGDRRKWFPWIHLADVVGLLLFAIDGKLKGPVNAVSPGIVRMADFARALGAAVHRPALVPAPELALRVALGELATGIVPGQRVLPNAALTAGYRFRFAGLQAALADVVSDRPGEHL